MLQQSLFAKIDHQILIVREPMGRATTTSLRVEYVNGLTPSKETNIRLHGGRKHDFLKRRGLEIF